MLDEYQVDVDSGPMPDSIKRAVARRRTTIRARRAGGVGAVLLVASVGVWFMLPGEGPGSSTGRIVAQEDREDELDITRLSPASVLALRLAGPENASTTSVSGRSRGDESIFGLRQQFERPPSPAS